MDTSTQLAFAEKIGAMDARIGNIEKDVSEIKTNVQRLLESRAESKGSRGALLTLGGGSATLGGLIVAAGQWISGTQPQEPAHHVAVPPAIVQPVKPAINDPSN